MMMAIIFYISKSASSSKTVSCQGLVGYRSKLPVSDEIKGRKVI